MEAQTPSSASAIDLPQAEPELPLESHREPSARTPRSKGITREQQLEGIPEKTAAEAARDAFNQVRDAYAAQLHVPPGGNVHHAIELDVLNQFPQVFAPEELNSLENMRGILPEFNDELHLSRIRTDWNRHYENLRQIISEEGLVQGTPEYNTRVRKYLIDARDEIDNNLKQFFTETRASYFSPPHQP
jgi:hypothetical protein